MFGDTLLGAIGGDELYGGMGQDTLSGGKDIDILSGGRGADRLYGGAGDDVLAGGRGADYLDGGADLDIADYGSADAGVLVDMQNMALNTGHAQGDTFVSIEMVDGSQFGDSLFGNSGDNTFFGRSGDDFLYGRDGDDILFGHEGNDTLRGGLGHDTFYSGLGNDLLFGGAGRDLFNFNGVESSLPSGADTIMDFEIAFDRLVIFEAGVDETNFHLAVFQVGANTVIHMSSGATITLINIDRNTFLNYGNYDVFD